MHHKRFNAPFYVKDTQEDGIFGGYASVFDVTDQQNEQVARGAFAKSLDAWRRINKLPKMLWQHDPKRPVGVWKQIREDHYGLWAEGKLLLDLHQGREAYSLLKQGGIDGLSIGFTINRSRRGYLSKIRVLEEVHLHEISLVTFAANPGATITACKALETHAPSVVDKLHTLRLTIKEMSMIS